MNDINRPPLSLFSLCSVGELASRRRCLVVGSAPPPHRKQRDAVRAPELISRQAACTSILHAKFRMSQGNDR
ncbi:MAG: hypothetical protein AB1490_17450 [Pseudomonadota bacterium]